MKRLIFTLLACGVAFGIASAKTMTINTVDGITVDGAGDDAAWESVEFITLDVTKPNTEADHNNVAKFKLAYDKDNIYMYTEITDATIDTTQSKNTYEKDCIEMFVALDTISQSYSNGTNASWQLRKVFDRDMENFPEKGFQAVEQEIAGGRSQEWALGWDSLASTIKDAATWDKKHIRFEVQNGDNDGAGRKSQLYWNSNADDQWSTTKNQGYVTLVNPVGINNVATANSSISIKSNIISTLNNTTITVYDIQGKVVRVANNANKLSVADLNRNQIYVAVANGKSRKFMVK